MQVNLSRSKQIALKTEKSSARRVEYAGVLQHLTVNTVDLNVSLTSFGVMWSVIISIWNKAEKNKTSCSNNKKKKAYFVSLLQSG